MTTAIAAALASIAVTTTTVNAAIVSTASHLATAPGDASLAAIVEILGNPPMPIDRRVAPTFQAVTGGTLQTISVTACARNGVPVVDAYGLSVSLTTLTNGQPSVILESAPVRNVTLAPSGTPFPIPHVLQAAADYTSQDIGLNAGETYAMVFSAAAYSDSFLILGNKLNYPAGDMGSNQPTGSFNFTLVTDIFFDVQVATIPEPATRMLAGMVGLSIACRVRPAILKI